MNRQPNTSLDKVVKIGTCQAGMCDGQAVAEISLDTLQFDPKTLEVRALPKPIKVCIKHKSWYFKYQEGLLDRINPERKKRGYKNPQQTGPQTNLGESNAIARRFRSLYG